MSLKDLLYVRFFPFIMDFNDLYKDSNSLHIVYYVDGTKLL